MKPKYVSILLAAVILATGCSTISKRLKPSAPQITFKSAAVNPAGADAVQIDYTFILKNKIGFPVKASNLQYTIYAEGSKIRSFNSTTNIDLNANQTKEVVLSEKIRYSDLNLNLNELFEKKSISVKLAGKTRYTIGYLKNVKLPIEQEVTVPISGVAAIPLPAMPEIKVAGIAAKSIDFLGANLDITLEVTNKESLPLSMSEIIYFIELNGKKVSEANDQKIVIVKGNSSEKITVNQRVNFLPLAASMPSIIKKGSIDVNLSGEATLGAGYLGKVTLPFSEKSTLGVPTFPSIKLKGARLAGLDIEGMNVDFIFELTNTSSSDFFFADLQYKIIANGREVIDGSNTDKIEVKANSTGEVIISNRIPFVDAIDSLMDIFQKNMIDIKVDGSVGNFMGSFSDVKLSLSGENKFMMPKLPSLKFRDLKFQSANFNPFNPRATFLVRFDVSNPNPFPVSINEIDYTFTAEGRELVDGNSNYIYIGGGANETISIPVSLRGREIFKFVPKLKKFPNISYQFEGKINLEISGQGINLPFRFPK
ncbi:MAG: LEA type 2 family protein [bacterium]|nr:LEA type 2 family protein [bacterium]